MSSFMMLLWYSFRMVFFFFFNDTATTEIYTLSLHDALPISLDHLDVTELEHPVALLYHGDLGAEGGEHGRVLDPDHAGARDHHRARDLLQVDDPVGVDDGALVELDAGRPGGPGTGGYHDLVRAGPADPALAAVDLHGVGVEEAAGARHGRDPVTGELAAH